MAVDQHVQRVNQGTEAWNQWRDSNPDEVPDLSQADLRGKQLSKINLKNANLKEVKFQFTNLNGAILDGANVQKAKLQEVNLQNASLESANLQNVNFFESNLQQANLQNANIQRAQFNDDVLLTQANLKGSDLSGATGLTVGQIESAITDKTTKLPDYLDEELEDGFLLQM